MSDYKDRETLYHLYHEQGLDQTEIADEIGCSQKTVSRWMDKLGVETDDRRIERLKKARKVNRATYEVTPKGYEVLKTRVGQSMKRISVHRLTAISEHGVEEVNGSVVHHKNGIPWDNRPQNLEVMSDSQHKTLHANERGRNENGEFV